MQVRLGSWRVPPIFDLIESLGQVPKDDMLGTFNMGVGMMMVIGERNLGSVAAVLKRKREKFWTIGRVVAGRPVVRYIEDKL